MHKEFAQLQWNDDLIADWRELLRLAIREDLAKYLSSRPCQTCLGARLREEARNVFIDDKNLPELTAYPIEKAYEFFKHLHLPGYRGTIAAKINKEITERLGFLVNVGLDYLSLTRSAETLSGGLYKLIYDYLILSHRLINERKRYISGIMYPGILGKLEKNVHVLPNEIDERIASLKLEAIGVTLDKLTNDQKKYLSSWEEGTN